MISTHHIIHLAKWSVSRLHDHMEMCEYLLHYEQTYMGIYVYDVYMYDIYAYECYICICVWWILYMGILVCVCMYIYTYVCVCICIQRWTHKWCNLKVWRRNKKKYTKTEFVRNFLLFLPLGSHFFSEVIVIIIIFLNNKTSLTTFQSSHVLGRLNLLLCWRRQKTQMKRFRNICLRMSEPSPNNGNS